MEASGCGQSLSVNCFFVLISFHSLFILLRILQVPEEVVADLMQLGQRGIGGIIAAQCELAAQLPSVRKRKSLPCWHVQGMREGCTGEWRGQNFLVICRLFLVNREALLG